MGKIRRRKKKKRKSLVGKFLKIVFWILTIYFISLTIFFVQAYMNRDENKTGGIVDKIVEKIAPKLPERTIGLIAVTDVGKGRTDGVMLVSYNSVNSKISIVSIPRDFKVSIPDYMWEVMVQNFPALRGSSPNLQKLNHIPRYAEERNIEFLQKYIEDLLQINIDYYAHLDLEGFRQIVDAVGGIDFYVPQDMYYSNKIGLVIDLKEGQQLLSGKDAEHLLRYRSNYTQGDLQRVKVHQDFMKAFINKVINLKSILSNPTGYYDTLINYIDTNFTITDALKYIGEASKIDINNIEAYTLPGVPKYVNGVSYVVGDSQELLEFGYEVFRKPTINPEDIVKEESYDKSIKVLNGSHISGIASDLKDLLVSNNYYVEGIGDLLDKKDKQTKIFVREEGHGYDLQKFFTNSAVIVNSMRVDENDKDVDILIVIGTDDELIKVEQNSTQNPDNIENNIEKEKEKSFDKSIIILNGGYTSGMAGDAKSILEQNGYKIDNVSDSQEDKVKETIIYVKNDGEAKDLEQYFDNTEIIVDIEITEKYEHDIVIIIGTDEKL